MAVASGLCFCGHLHNNWFCRVESILKPYPAKLQSVYVSSPDQWDITVDIRPVLMKGVTDRYYRTNAFEMAEEIIAAMKQHFFVEKVDLQISSEAEEFKADLYLKIEGKHES